MEPLSTEQKIIQAASRLFSEKGYAATRLRDISQESDTNLALINYYFRSKENLFKMVIKQKIEQLFGSLNPLLADESIELKEKVTLLVNTYTTLLLENGDLALFVLNEMRTNQNMLAPLLKIARLSALPVIQKQLDEAAIDITPADFIMNVLSLIIFPFVSKALFVSAGMFKEEEFEEFVLSRKEKMQGWIIQSLKKKTV